MSSRFNKDTDKDVLKCLYYEKTPEYSLLSQQIRKTASFVDEIIIVGGYKYEDLVLFIKNHLKEWQSKINTIYNEHYHDYGSGYSLLKGIEAVSSNADEVVFIEGDLFFPSSCVKSIIKSGKDVISINNEPILSNKAVVLYMDSRCYPHYIYDTSHSCLEIKEPFTAVYNSAQMWKFRNVQRLNVVCGSLTQRQKEGTNLEIIQRYFGTLKSDALDIIQVEKWYNCNTVSDYRNVYKK